MINFKEIFMSARIKILITAILITIATIIFCFSAFSTPITTENSSDYSNQSLKYLLKDFNGMLAVYERDKKSPIEVLDVRISSLPERDAEKIKKGIFANTLNEIYSIIEDYE